MISHLKRQFHGTSGIIDQLAQNSGTLLKQETGEPQEVRSFINEGVSTSKQAPTIDEEYKSSSSSDSNCETNDTLAVEEEMSLITVAVKKRDKKYVPKPHEEYQADSNPTDVLGAIKRKREEERIEDR